MLQAADRWYISDEERCAAGGRLLAEIIRNILPQVDAQLHCLGLLFQNWPPMENQPPYSKRWCKSGNRHRFEVRCFSKGLGKRGELKVVSVEASTAVARLHKLDRSMRKVEKDFSGLPVFQKTPCIVKKGP